MEQRIKKLAQKLGSILQQKGLYVSTVESCTGGGIAYAITSVSGSSSWFNQGYVTYSNESKHSLVGVNANTLQNFGAVSQQTVEEMASGCREKSGADLSVSVSGIAGPTGGTDEKPVGTVWMGISRRDGKLISRRFLFDGDRDSVRMQTIICALEALIDSAGELS